MATNKPLFSITGQGTPVEIKQEPTGQFSASALYKALEKAIDARHPDSLVMPTVRTQLELLEAELISLRQLASNPEYMPPCPMRDMIRGETHIVSKLLNTGADFVQYRCCCGVRFWIDVDKQFRSMNQSEMRAKQAAIAAGREFCKCDLRQRQWNGSGKCLTCGMTYNPGDRHEH